VERMRQETRKSTRDGSGDGGIKTPKTRIWKNISEARTIDLLPTSSARRAHPGIPANNASVDIKDNHPGIDGVENGILGRLILFGHEV